MARTLEQFHAELEAMMARGDALLATRDPARSAAVKESVAAAVALVAAYQLFVHRELFAPMLAAADDGMRGRITELKVECIALTEDLRFNAAGFLASDAPLDWDGLSVRVAWFNGRVRDHLARVRALLAERDAAQPAPRMGPVGVAVFG